MNKKITALDLSINLASKKESELFKWFLACLLFGKPIQQEVAKRTYFEFVQEGLVTPDDILAAGWDKLVEVLDRGHYVRYDFLTADKLLDIMSALLINYGGEISYLIKLSKNKRDFNRLIQEFKGIGPKTAEIFINGL